MNRQAVFAGHHSEYLLAAVPDPVLLEGIGRLRNQYCQQFGLIDAAPVEQQLTLAWFSISERMEPTFIRWLQRICSFQEGGNVRFDTFAAGSGGSVVLTVQDARPFKQLAELLRPVSEYLQSSGCAPAFISTNPFIPFIGGLSPAKQTELLAACHISGFNMRCSMDRLLLFRRQHALGAFELLQVFGLRPPVSECLYGAA